ncbi:hypothetical protein EV191_11653 [Tamaricihabitans halophyticus]|uniref:Pyridoxal phosphate homeostasis protein n=1 Tax=Tamaricihabitans halophyticus TaxID=1262583 RepID=A0A4R2QEE1_9PSEU|nr:YggS family pyridoxal phosphate-dependent enzyme [Tamaricihabitans halophyticus]TCP45411.1 hypothetical protein EV191_11653 [Tamaricihabitans halophyticus]
MTEQRKAELAEALAEVRARIERACVRAGRSPSEVRMLAVTKTFPASDAALLADLGVTDLAENKVQEAAGKAAEVGSLRPDATVRWHLVGQLQRNKARSVARWAAEVQTVDSTRVAGALDRAVRSARESGERTGPLDVLVQLSLDDDPARGGCPAAELPEVIDNITRSSEMSFRGLMAVAPLGVSPDSAFERLAEIAARIRHDHPEATELSAGMSGDLDEAIAHGATCVRVGTALLGGRRLTSG